MTWEYWSGTEPESFQRRLRRKFWEKLTYIHNTNKIKQIHLFLSSFLFQCYLHCSFTFLFWKFTAGNHNFRDHLLPSGSAHMLERQWWFDLLQSLGWLCRQTRGPWKQLLQTLWPRTGWWGRTRTGLWLGREKLIYCMITIWYTRRIIIHCTQALICEHTIMAAVLYSWKTVDSA